MHRLKANVMKMWKSVACTNLLLRKHGLITIYQLGTEEEEEVEEDGTQKQQPRLLLVVLCT